MRVSRIDTSIRANANLIKEQQIMTHKDQKPITQRGCVR